MCQLSVASLIFSQKCKHFEQGTIKLLTFSKCWRWSRLRALIHPTSRNAWIWSSPPRFRRFGRATGNRISPAVTNSKNLDTDSERRHPRMSEFMNAPHGFTTDSRNLKAYPDFMNAPHGFTEPESISRFYERPARIHDGFTEPESISYFVFDFFEFKFFKRTKTWWRGRALQTIPLKHRNFFGHDGIVLVLFLDHCYWRCLAHWESFRGRQPRSSTGAKIIPEVRNMLQKIKGCLWRPDRLVSGLLYTRWP